MRNPSPILVAPRTNALHGRARWALGWLATLAVLCVVILAGLSGPSLAAAPAKAPAVAGDAQQQELNALEARVKALSSNPNSPEWSKLRQDFDTWARKWGVQIREHTGKAASAASSGGGVGTLGLHDCSPTDDIPGYHCYLFPSPKGTCRYVCTPIKKK